MTKKEIRRLYYANPHTSLADFEEILVRIFDAIEAAPTIEVPKWIPFEIRPTDDEEREYYKERIPSARPREGKWIKRHGVVNCSNCNHSRWSDCFEDTVMSFNFCPNCGADMRGNNNE